MLRHHGKTDVGDPSLDFFVSVDCNRFLSSLFLQVQISKQLFCSFAQVQKLQDLSLRTSETEDDCHCVRNKIVW